MNTQTFKQDQQTIGQYEVLMYEQGIVLFSPHSDSARVLTSAEALMLLKWLRQHEDNLYMTAQAEYDKK